MLINYSQIKQRFLDEYRQNWYAVINNSTRLESYALFKHNLNIEPYLNIITESKFRTALCRFRTSSHDLLIESGRYVNQPRNERICTNCNLNFIENEYHFLLICPKFRELRKNTSKILYIMAI